MEGIILDLCGGTGSWSRPYARAGYDVRIITLPEHDVTIYEPPQGVVGILAAPPCTQFSIARQDSTAAQPRDLRKGMIAIKACLDIIWECTARGDLQFWALENPGSGYLKKFLGKPALEFHPTYFGDKHTKLTALWGHFKEPKRVYPSMNFGDSLGDYQSQILPEGYILPPDMTKRQATRSITPPGFAQAFYEANKLRKDTDD